MAQQLYRIADPNDPKAKEVRVGWHVDGSRRVPVYWPCGLYEAGESGSVGGSFTGYNYVYYRHLESGFQDYLKGHQIDAVEKLGIMTPAEAPPAVA